MQDKTDKHVLFHTVPVDAADVFLLPLADKGKFGLEILEIPEVIVRQSINCLLLLLTPTAS